MQREMTHPGHKHRNPTECSDGALGRAAFCHHYNIGLTTFHAIVKNGDLRVHKVGRRTLVDPAEAQRWWQSCAQGPK